MDVSGLDWDNVRVFLGVLRASSLRQAAEDLGVSHPTVRRRLDALEETLGLQLFDRRPDGLHATPAAIELQALAEDVERGMHALSRAATAADPEMRGHITVTLPPVIATDLLMPLFVSFSQRWPKITLEIATGCDVKDLSRREADVAIRFMPLGRQPNENLVGRKVATIYGAVYGCGDAWIGWKGPGHDSKWIKESEFPDLPTIGLMHNPETMRAACIAGLGLGRLPCFYAAPLADAWVLVHPDLRRSPRLRVFRDEITATLERLQPRLAGHCHDTAES